MAEKGPENEEVELKVYTHCGGCANKVSNCLKGFTGVEDIVVDSTNHKVIVKGKKANPIRVLERLQKKYSRSVELISPKPRIDHKQNNNEVQEKQEPKIKTLVLKMYIHCEGCALDIKRNIGRMEGIMSVEADREKSLVVIKGVFDIQNLVKNITKRLGKYVEIVKHECENEDQKKDKEEEIMEYSPQCHTKYSHLSLVLSDENVFSCSIM